MISDARMPLLATILLALTYFTLNSVQSQTTPVRKIPARTLPTPTTVSPELQKEIAPAWNTTTSDWFNTSGGTSPQLWSNSTADTALFGGQAATKCGLDFFGVDHAVFASDVPFEPKPGLYIRETIRCIEGLDITAADKGKIYEGNARRLLKLS